MSEEDFRLTMTEGMEAYIRYRKRQDAGEEKEYERELQEEQIKLLEERMRENKNIIL